MHVAVSDINYIVESDASWEKKSGSVAKLWTSNIQSGYCAMVIDSNANMHALSQ